MRCKDPVHAIGIKNGRVMLYQKKACVTPDVSESISSYGSIDQCGDQKPDDTESEALQGFK